MWAVVNQPCLQDRLEPIVPKLSYIHLTYWFSRTIHLDLLPGNHVFLQVTFHTSVFPHKGRPCTVALPIQTYWGAALSVHSAAIFLMDACFLTTEGVSSFPAYSLVPWTHLKLTLVTHRSWTQLGILSFQENKARTEPSLALLPFCIFTIMCINQQQLYFVRKKKKKMWDLLSQGQSGPQVLIASELKVWSCDVGKPGRAEDQIQSL